MLVLTSCRGIITHASGYVRSRDGLWVLQRERWRSASSLCAPCAEQEGRGHDAATEDEESREQWQVDAGEPSTTAGNVAAKAIAILSQVGTLPSCTSQRPV